MIGLGSGVTAGAALAHAGTRVEAVEISPEVVQAAELFRHASGDVLRHPRLRIVVGDGRNHLRLTSEALRRDHLGAVQSLDGRGLEPLHARLLPDGARRASPRAASSASGRTSTTSPRADLRTVIASFTDAFPHAALFLLNEGDVLLLGAESPVEAPPPGELAARMDVPAVRADLERRGGPGRLRHSAASSRSAERTRGVGGGRAASYGRPPGARAPRSAHPPFRHEPGERPRSGGSGGTGGRPAELAAPRGRAHSRPDRHPRPHAGEVGELWLGLPHLLRGALARSRSTFRRWKGSSAARCSRAGRSRRSAA